MDSIYGSSVSSKRIGGLMSGLDTEDLVKQMSYATQSRINKQFQAQQKLVYKQDAYRDVISRLVKFSDKYFSGTSKTNILSPSFFRANTAKSSSSNVTVSGDMEALKDFTIDNIESVASAARFTSSKEISSREFTSGVVESSKQMNALAGESITLKNGENTYVLKISDNFEFKETDTQEEKLIKIKEELNKAISNTKLKGKLNYVVDENQLKLKEVGGGDPQNIEVTAVSQYMKDKLHIQVGGGNTAGSSSADITETEFLKTVSLQDALKNGYITFDYNGVQKRLTFPDTITDADALVSHLQEELNKMYGTHGKDAFGDDIAKIQVGKSASGEITFKTVDKDGNDDKNNLFGITSTSAMVSRFTGLSDGQYNRVNRDVAISSAKLKTPLDILADGENYEIDINGEKFTFGKNETINNIINKINSSNAGVTISHSATTDQFTVVAKETGSHVELEITDVAGKGNLAEVLFGKKDVDYTVKNGEDTVMTVTKNGVSTDLVRSTSNVSFDGINIGLTNKAKGETNITFTVSEETDKVVEKMAKFVEDYNEIITYLDEQIRQKPNRKFEPLTDEQRKEMKESEVKLWDEKAKEGMLYLDSDMNALLYGLKEAVSGFVEGNSTHLSSIGIAPAFGDYTGELIFNEDKFRAAYAKDANKIEEFFTKNGKNASMNEKGIAQRLNDVFSKNIGTMGLTGILVEKAGTKGTSSEKDNFLYERIKEYDEMITKLKTKLVEEQTRYRAKFTELEKALAKMNSQSSWLSSQFQ